MQARHDGVRRMLVYETIFVAFDHLWFHRRHHHQHHHHHQPIQLIAKQNCRRNSIRIVSQYDFDYVHLYRWIDYGLDLNE